MYGSKNEDFLGFNTFSLYDYIGPALGPKCSRGHEFHDKVGLCDHNNHAFIFHKYISEVREELRLSKISHFYNMAILAPPLCLNP